MPQSPQEYRSMMKRAPKLGRSLVLIGIPTSLLMALGAHIRHSTTDQLFLIGPLVIFLITCYPMATSYSTICRNGGASMKRTLSLLGIRRIIAILCGLTAVIAFVLGVHALPASSAAVGFLVWFAPDMITKSPVGWDQAEKQPNEPIPSKHE